MKNECHKLFLAVLKNALRNEKTDSLQASSELWMEVFHLAEMHHVLPMVMHVASDAAKQYEQSFLIYKRKVREIIMKQFVQNECLFNVLDELKKVGIEPLIVKGLCCREVYPVPELRFSSDEDLYVKEDQFIDCCNILLNLGAFSECKDFNQDEVTFVFPNQLVIELHRSLFPKDAAYGYLNAYFVNAFQRAEKKVISGHEILMMHPEDHWLYLVLHAYKHFLHGGCGIRQICDIAMYAKVYSSRIDWVNMNNICEKVRIDCLVSGWMKIAYDYLGYNESMIAFDQNLDVDELLEDILEAGVYGTSSLTRRHTASITLSAYDGKTKTGSFIRTLFPSISSLKGKYAFLTSYPVLLPYAWMKRWVEYAKEVGFKKDSSLKDTLELAKKRTELFEKYSVVIKGKK